VKTSIIYLYLIHSIFAYGAEEIKVNASDVPPFGYAVNGVPTGINIDILNQLEHYSGIKFNINLYPHARVLFLLNNADPDLLIIFRNSCDKNSDKYEIQKHIYSLRPSLFFKKGVDTLSKNLAYGRLNGTCSAFAKELGIEKNITNLPSMDIAIEMLRTNRLDGICGIDQVVEYSAKKDNFWNQIYLFKSAERTKDFDAVVCRKKSLPESVKKKLDEGMLKVKIPKI
jgi:ABC-type amino acid transport substrate-binding protein